MRARRQGSGAESASDAGIGAELRGAFQKVISKELNPLFKIHGVSVVDKLPRTVSNKVRLSSIYLFLYSKREAAARVVAVSFEGSVHSHMSPLARCA